jgi:ribosomal protein L11 methyltransferase
MKYTEAKFTLDPLLPAREVLVAELAERGFESFTESDDGLSAFIPSENFSPELLENLMAAGIPDQKLNFTIHQIKEENWNAVWESGFEPIVVDEICCVRAPFHPDSGKYSFDIIIEPKMSFGTGHHDTTYLIISRILKHNFKDKNVLDMGCGTGVLAILASKLGASNGDAIDIDQWAFENSVENFERNDCKNFNVYLGGAEAIPAETKYDVILANINRNILTRDMGLYAAALKPSGIVLFSGFYESDFDEIDLAAKKSGLSFISKSTKNEWCMLEYVKN